MACSGLRRGWKVPMKQISNKEYERYQQYQADKLHGRILTPDGLRVVCAGLDNDPEKIGIHMLEMLAEKLLSHKSQQEEYRRICGRSYDKR